MGNFDKYLMYTSFLGLFCHIFRRIMCFKS